MPQTREHLILARQTNIKQLAVFINKCDQADEEMQSLVEMEIQELLSQYGFDTEKCPIIFGSALCALEGTKPEIGKSTIEKLLESLDKFETPERVENVPFMLPIETIHSIAGKGTVVTGKLMQGTLKKGDEVVLQGHDMEIKSSVNSIESFHKTVNEALAGNIFEWRYICLNCN